MNRNNIAEALIRVLESPNETDRNMETANIVDGIYRLARAIEELTEVLNRR